MTIIIFFHIFQLLRLRIPCEINVSKSKCQRSKATGNLVVIMSKVNPNENVIEFKSKDKKKTQSINSSKNETEKNDRVKYKKKSNDGELSLLELMLQESSISQTPIVSTSTSLRDETIKSDFSLKFVKDSIEKNEGIDSTLLEINNGETSYSSKIMELD